MRSRKTSTSRRRRRPVGLDGHHGEHTALGGVVGVADELGDAELLDDVAVGVEVDAVAGALLRRLGPLALLGHLGVEPGEVDRDVALGGDLLGELSGKP